MVEGGGAGGLGLLSGPFMGAGIPNISGGHAGPSNAYGQSDATVTFGNAFSVAGQGGNASATGSPQAAPSNNLVLIGMAVLAVILVVKK